MMNPLFLLASAGGAALVAYNIISNNMQRKHIHETCALNIKNKNETMDQLFSEYEMYKRELAEYDEYHEKVLEAFDQF